MDPKYLGNIFPKTYPIFRFFADFCKRLFVFNNSLKFKNILVCFKLESFCYDLLFFTLILRLRYSAARRGVAWGVKSLLRYHIKKTGISEAS